MPDVRPYQSHSLEELKVLAAGTQDRVTLGAVLDELSRYRKTRGAKQFENTLRARMSSPCAQRQSPVAPEQQADLPLESEPSAPRPRSNAKPSSIKPTPQQNEAVEAFMTGGTLKISAFAGSGKTSTLKLMANARAGRGLYLAFNSRTAQEASAEFPGEVDCRTTHSIAARSVRSRHHFGRPKMFSRIGAMQLAAAMSLQPLKVEDAVTLTPQQQAFLFLATLRNFCQSASDTLSAEHVFTTPRLLGLSPSTRADVQNWVLSEAQALWSRMTNLADEIPLGHDGYLKLWALGKPRLDYEYVMLDEAQDTNPVVLDVLQRQRTQMVYVGDRHQQIYEWRGAVNAMALIGTDCETALTQSFRFGAEIAAAASKVLRKLGETRSIEGNPVRDSRIVAAGVADAILARTNATVIKETLAALDERRRPHIVGGTKELKRLVGDVFALQRGEPGSHPDFFGFKHWEEVVAFAETDEGENLRAFVTLVLAHGAGALYAAITKSEPDPDKANLAISTAHKAKGSEWSAVSLASDFSATPADAEPPGEEELRLFYVAMTRAKEVLILEPAMLDGFIGATISQVRRSHTSTLPETKSDSCVEWSTFTPGEWPAGLF